MPWSHMEFKADFHFADIMVFWKSIILSDIAFLCDKDVYITDISQKLTAINML